MEALVEKEYKTKNVKLKKKYSKSPLTKNMVDHLSKQKIESATKESFVSDIMEF